MSDTVTDTRFFRVLSTEPDAAETRFEGDTKCEHHTVESLNNILFMTGYPVVIDNADDGMELLNLLSRINGQGGDAIREELDPEFQVCLNCEADARLAFNDKAAS